MLGQHLSQLQLNPTKGLKNKTTQWKYEMRKGFVILYVPGEPHGGEVTPAQFPDYMVFSIVQISYFYMVVATYKKRSMLIRDMIKNWSCWL